VRASSSRTSGREGLDLIARLQRDHKSLPVVIMTGWGSVGVAIETMRVGVRDFVRTPWDNPRLVAQVRGERALGAARPGLPVLADAGNLERLTPPLAAVRGPHATTDRHGAGRVDRLPAAAARPAGPLAEPAAITIRPTCGTQG